MKARYIALIVFALIAIVGGLLGYYLIGRDTEHAVDVAIERDIDAAGLNFAREAARKAPAGTAWLEALYAQPEQATKLNQGFGVLVADWSRDVSRLQGRLFPRSAIDANRLSVEFDERFG